MYTEELLSVIPIKEVIGQLPNVIKDISVDSRSVQPKSLFICIKGYTVDGHDFAQQAVDAGATVVVTEKPLALEGQVAQVVVQNTDKVLGLLAAKFFDYPSQDITMIGVT